MGTYNSAVITNGGQSMIAQAVAGASLEFTTIKTSSYAYPAGTNLATLTTINGIKQSKDITGAAVYNSRVIKISAAVDNTGISTAYAINTIGIYAKVGSSAESLFAVVTASAADTMPAYDSKPYSYIYEINLTMQNAANVTVTVNAAGLVNVAGLNAAKVEIRGEIADLKSAIDDVYKKYSDFKVKLSIDSLEFGNYGLSDGSLVKSDSKWWIRSKTPIKVPAYSQFIITNPAFRGYIYVSTDGVTYISYNWMTSTSKRFMPLVDSYVAFKFANSDNYSMPTIADVYAGFYVQFPFDTKDYSELVSYDSRLRPSEKVNPHGKFIIGSIKSGVPNMDKNNRIIFTNMFSFDTDVTIRIADGFRIGVHTFENGVFANDSGWKSGSYTISADTTFKFVVARISEQTETAEKWWMDFVKSVTFEASEKAEAVPNISLNKPFMFSSRPKFALHRGLQSEAPENSVPAFRLAGQAGAWGIETDVYETSDGHLICIHDDTVDRTTDGTGNVRDKTFAQIQALTIDAGANIQDYPNLKIPTFEEYLSICKTYGCVAFIEIKGVTNLQLLYDTVVDYGMLYNSVFTVWEALLNLVRAIDVDAIVPCMLNGYSSATSYDAVLTIAKKYPNVMLGLQTGTPLTGEIIAEAHQNNITVGCWTVNNSSDAIEYFERGIDIVTTNSLTDFN